MVTVIMRTRRASSVRIPDSGATRFFSMSFDSAFNGET